MEQFPSQDSFVTLFGRRKRSHPALDKLNASSIFSVNYIIETSSWIKTHNLNQDIPVLGDVLNKVKLIFKVDHKLLPYE